METRPETIVGFVVSVSSFYYNMNTLPLQSNWICCNSSAGKGSVGITWPLPSLLCPLEMRGLAGAGLSNGP